MKYFWDLLLYLLGPLVYLQSKVAWPFKMKRLINSFHYYKLRGTLRDADCFLTYTRGELSNVLNPSGDLKHGFIVTDAKNEICMEVVGSGSRYFKFADIIHHYDRIVHTRPTFLSSMEIAEIDIVAKIFENLPYDLIFENNDWLRKGRKRAVYCFELCVSILQSLTENEVNFKEVEMVKGKRVYDSNTLLDPALFKKLYDSKEVTE